ncbi:MAG: hypothetical protein Hyperionvirus38_14 [Hyperionvirus sp.]|uniref:Uncharacterized protein n=1 Tax=Hyperionvirus sp. TaxID=2487770 RepID=A0A3G5AC22_9VIRU|nr:MAG: hypothetical protein Hyperionvirus38_14 [Hyperionvirus sp.]
MVETSNLQRMGSSQSCCPKEKIAKDMREINKLLTEGDWAKVQMDNYIPSGADDLKSGFMRCCYDDQVQAIYDRFYKGSSMIVVTLSRKILHEHGFSVRDEINVVTGQTYPHIYALREDDHVPYGAVIKSVFL